jgi:hypothetical protein
MTPLERLHARKNEDENGCWTISPLKGHYSSFSLNGQQMMGHRASWIIHFGEIPEGLFVCHKCDNAGCVNPDHLFLGTPKDNVHDMMSKGRLRNQFREGQNNPLDTSDRNQRISVNFLDYQHEALRNLAHKDRTSINDHVRRAVDDYLKKKSEENEP